MKNTGTLKLEVIKPIDIPWDGPGSRIRALSSTLSPALNSTLRRVFDRAVAQIENKRSGDDVDTAWQLDARKILREVWNQELARSFEYQTEQFTKGKRKTAPDARSFLPVGDLIVSETVKLLLLSRFTGDHLRDLIACRSSFPSFGGEQAVYCEGRYVEISGSAAEARLSLPLWGGKKPVVFAVAPAGGSARALWRKLVRDFARRQEIVDLEKVIKKKDYSKEEKQRALSSLEESGAFKLGRVGWKHDKKRNKLFMFISWTEYRSDVSRSDGQTAAVNFGVNVFAQALAEDGTTWDDVGNDIRVIRGRFSARRKSIQKCLRRLGRGSRGHGKKRRYLPITKLEKREALWTETRVRQHAADLLNWCAEHNIVKLVLHDLSGQREQFERSTKGEAAEQMKRFIHSWPWYAETVAIERQAKEFGVQVVKIPPGGESSRCPDCGHYDVDNVRLVDGGGELLIHGGRLFKEVVKWTRFECRVCGTKAKGDMVTCANMLLEIGAKNPLGKMQEKARKRALSNIKTEMKRKGASNGLKKDKQEIDQDGSKPINEPLH